ENLLQRRHQSITRKRVHPKHRHDAAEVAFQGHEIDYNQDDRAECHGFDSVPRKVCRYAARGLKAGITQGRTCKTPEKRVLNIENLDVLYTTEGLCGYRKSFLIRLKSVFPDRIETFADKGVDERVASAYDNCNDKRQRRARRNERD